MGEFVWLAMSVTIFAWPNPDGTPALRTVEQGRYETHKECEMWRRDSYETELSALDSVTGKAVLKYYFDCLPQSTKD